MKEKVKIWSRRRLLGAFLAFLGLAAVATAQTSWPNSGNNGTVAGMCGGELFAVTRTIDELNDGTDIEITFTGVSHGDSYYFIAATGGSLTEVTCDETIGKYLNITSDGDGDLPNVVNPVQFAGSFTATDIDNGLTADERKKTITVKHTDPENNTGGVFKLGVFVYSAATGCYSDAYYITINVLNNIYAYLLLNNGSSHQYICNGETTMAIGFELCNLPVGVNGTLKYNVLASSTVTNADISGKTSDKLAISDNATDNDGTIQLTVNTAEENVTLEIQPTASESDKRQVVIGAQELVNASASIAGQMEFSFPDEMTFTYNVTENDANGQERTRTVVLPVIFQTANQCGTDGYGDGTTENPYITDNVFTVHVAPNFEVRALAYKEGERPESVTGGYMDGTRFVTGGAEAPTFCQGLDAYLHTEYSTTEGSITSYTWSQVTPAQQLTITSTTERAPVTSDLTQLAYQLKVVTLWNDAATNGNYGAGCSADDVIDITVTEAPKLLVQATNSTFTHDGDVCPGTPINISAQDGPLAADQTTITAENILSTGNGIIIDHNNANFSYTITPSGADLKVFDTWRATEVTSGNLPVVNDFFDNEDNVDPAGNGTITYTIETITTGEGVGTNVCPLVNFDGTALTETTTDGVNTTTTVTDAVKLIYTVSPRPQFQLGAN